jgi:hypothetical protein
MTTGRGFRLSFLVGFSTRIGRRLDEAVRTTTAEAVEEQGTGLLPVLAERVSSVEDLMGETFSHVTERGLSLGDMSGWASGVAAADAAVIAPGPLIEEGTSA